MSDKSQQLLDQVQQAIADRSTLNIVGGASKCFMGRETTADAILNTREHSGIVSYQPVELVLTARAGTPLAEIHNELDKHKQMLAFEPPMFSRFVPESSVAQTGATIGGTLACNQSGAARPWCGSVRDAVLGIRLINGLGEHCRFGGQVMKNVAGYDVSRAQAGALGTLGLITEISLKVMPKPDLSKTLTQAMNAERAIQIMNTVAGRAQPLSAACWVEGQLYLRWSGVTSAVDKASQRFINEFGGQFVDEAESFWGEINNHQHRYFEGTDSLWRFSVNSTASHWLESERWLIDWGGSQRWLRGSAGELNDFATLESQASNAGGQVGLFRGGNRTAEVFASQPTAIKQLHQRLKAAFDPSGLFNPGRLYSWM